MRVRTSRLLSLLMCAVLTASVLFSAQPAYAAGAAEVDADSLFSFDVSESDITKAVLTVKLKPGSNLVAAAFEVEFDSSVLAYNNTKSYCYPLDGQIHGTVGLKLNTLNIAVTAAVAQTRLTGEEKLFRLYFDVIDSTDSTAGLTVSAKEVYVCESSDTQGNTPVKITQSFTVRELSVKLWEHVTGVELDKSTLALKLDATAVITATVLPALAKDKTVVWLSMDPEIAAVDSSGRVTALKSGITEIKAVTNEGGFTASCRVSVACEHSWGPYVKESDSTCTNPGKEVRICTKCLVEDERDLPLDPQNHVFSDEWTTDAAASCTEPGSKSHHCTLCGEKTDITPIAPVPHTPGAAATCAAPQTCTVCSQVLVPVKPHTPGAAATCTEPQKCTVCSTVTQQALGHDFADGWTIDKPATMDEEGSKSHHCTRCDEKADVTVIPKLNENTLIPKADSGLTVDREDNTVTGNITGIKASELTDKFVNERVYIVNSNGKELKSGDPVGTGCRVVLRAETGEQLDSLTVFIKGDVNGDGSVTTDDARKVLRVAVELEELTGVYKKAACVIPNENDKIMTDDARKILRVSVGIDSF